MKRSHEDIQHVSSFGQFCSPYTAPKYRRHDYDELELLVRRGSFLWNNFIFEKRSCGINSKLLTYECTLGRHECILQFDKIPGLKLCPHLLIFFFNPHFVFLEVMRNIASLLGNKAAVIGITCSRDYSCEAFNFPIVTNGEKIIRRLHLLDPLGGAKYPLECCLVVDSRGDLKDIIYFRHNQDRCFTSRLLTSINDDNDDDNMQLS